jgi:hypothetical protein
VCSVSCATRACFDEIHSVNFNFEFVTSHRLVVKDVSRYCVIGPVLSNVFNVKRGLRPRNVPTTIPFPDKRCGYHEQIMLIANPNGNALTVIIYQQVVRGQLRLGSLSISPNSKHHAKH